jgi:hypothetical protein
VDECASSVETVCKLTPCVSRSVARVWRNRWGYARGNTKKKEYQELVGVLAEGMAMYIQQYKAQSSRSEEDAARLHEMLARILVVLRTRLFIRKNINLFHVAKRWNAVSSNFEEDLDNEKFATEVGKIIVEISDAATKDLAG